MKIKNLLQRRAWKRTRLWQTRRPATDTTHEDSQNHRISGHELRAYNQDLLRVPNAVVWIFLTGALAPAQTTQGLISGRVLDSLSGRFLSGAEIRCESYTVGTAILARTGG